MYTVGASYLNKKKLKRQIKKMLEDSDISDNSLDIYVSYDTCGPFIVVEDYKEYKCVAKYKSPVFEVMAHGSETYIRINGMRVLNVDRDNASLIMLKIQQVVMEAFGLATSDFEGL